MDWIDATEKLPEEGQRVIVACYLIGAKGWNSGVQRIYICTYGRLVSGLKSMLSSEGATYSEPIFYLEGRDIRPLTERTKVTHWMPLPELPNQPQLTMNI